MLLILISVFRRVSPDTSVSIDWRIDSCIALASLRSRLWMLHMSLISCLLRLKWVYIQVLYLCCPFRCRDSETSYDHAMRRNIGRSGFATMTVFPVSCHKVVGQAWLCPEWRIKALVRLWFCQQIVIMVFSLLYTYLQKWNSFYMYSTTYTYLEHDIVYDVVK